MVDQPTPPAAGDAQLERLLVELLDRYESGGADAVEPLLAEHPSYASTLRRHLSRLLGLGLVHDDARAPRGDFPERLGEFRLLQRLGSGGMGVVYLAEQESLGRRVALKLVRPELLWFDGARERFRREVDSIARLQHPGIVPVFAAGEDQGVPWLAMQYVVGATLDEVLCQLAGRDPATLTGRDLQQAVHDALHERGLATAEQDDAPDDAPFAASSWAMACVHIVRDVGRALQHAHRRGVLHRDVKPGNVVLTRDGRALLLDFGLASAHGAVRLTASHGVLGSPAYMSPEQLRGERELDARTDVYGLGLTLYELLTHRAPYAVETVERARALVLAGTAPRPRTYNRAVPRDLEVVCKKAIEVERRARYADAQAFADDLDNVLASRPIQAVPPSPLQRAQRWTRRHPTRAVAAAAAFLLLFVAPMLFLVQQRNANAEIRAALDAASRDRDLANEALATASRERDRANEALAVARRDRDRAGEAVEVLLEQVANEDLLRVPRMQNLRRALLTSARDFHERLLADGGNDADSAARTADAAMQVAMLEGELGHATEALASAARAVQLARDLTETDRQATDHRLRLGKALTLRGKMHQQRGELGEARRDLDAAGTVLEHALVDAGQPEAVRAAIELLSCHQALSLVLRQLEDRDGIAAVERQLDAVWQRLSRTGPEQAPLAEAFERYYTALVDRAFAAEQSGDHDIATTVLDRCDALLREHAGLSNRADQTLLLHRLRGQVVRASLARAADDLDNAERHYLDVIDGLQPLLEHNPENAYALRMLANAQNNLMVMLAGVESRSDDQLRLLEAAIGTLRRLATAAPEVVENRVNLAASIANLGAIRKQQGDTAAAVAAFTEAADLIEVAVTEVPTRKEWQDHLYKITWFSGQAAGEVDDHDALRRIAPKLAGLRADDAKTQRIAAGLLATAVAAAGADANLPTTQRAALVQQLQQQAMILLRRAAELGCTDLAWLRDGDEFAPLRDCEGYAEILAQVAANVERAGR